MHEATTTFPSTAPLLSVEPGSLAEAVLAAPVLARNPALVLPALQPGAVREQQQVAHQQWNHQQEIALLSRQLLLLQCLEQEQQQQLQLEPSILNYALMPSSALVSLSTPISALLLAAMQPVLMTTAVWPGLCTLALGSSSGTTTITDTSIVNSNVIVALPFSTAMTTQNV
jgi:hypothetical protein